eukprot:102294_1
MHCFAATHANSIAISPFIRHDIVNQSNIHKTDGTQKANNSNNFAAQLPSINNLCESKRGRKKGGVKATGRYKYGKSRRNKWNHKKKYSTKLEKTNKILKTELKRTKSKFQNRLNSKANVIHKLKKENTNLKLDLQHQIIYDSLDFDDINEQQHTVIDLDWNSIESEEKALEIHFPESQILALKVMECSIEVPMADGKIHTHLKNQNIMNGMKDSYVWSTSTIKRYLKWNLLHIIGLVIAIILIVYVGATCAHVWDDTTRKQRKFMAQHTQCNTARLDKEDCDLLDINCDNTDVYSLCISYEESINGAEDGALKSLVDGFSWVNKYIDYWKQPHSKKFIENVWPQKQLCFLPVEDRIVINSSDRFGVNPLVHEDLKGICCNLDTNQILFSCLKHDWNNTWVVVQKFHISLNHTENNELKGIPHPLSICTYMARLWKLTTLWPYNKAKYMQHYLFTNFSDKMPLINYWLTQLIFAKGMRELNLLNGLIFLLLLSPYFIGMLRYKWRDKSVCTATANQQISALSNKLIISESLQGAFLYWNVYFPVIESAKQFSLKKIRLLYKNCLEKIEISITDDYVLAEMLFGWCSMVPVNGLSNNRIIMDNLGQFQKEADIFWIGLVSILSTFMFSDICNIDKDGFSFNDILKICDPLWDDLKLKCAHVISMQCWFLYYLFTMNFEDILHLMVAIKIILKIVYEYLMNECNWKFKIMQENIGIMHLRNNNDRIETTHSVSTKKLEQSNVLISPHLLKVKVLAKDNNIIRFLLKLFMGSEDKQELLFHILEQAELLNVSKEILTKKKEEDIKLKLSKDYFNEHLKRKKTRRKRKENTIEKENIDKKTKNNKTTKRKRKSAVLTETDDNFTEFDGDSSTFECSYAPSKQQNQVVTVRQSKRRRRSINYNDNDNSHYQYINSLS